jgi:acetylornithine/N-succinyldiaminopimelate aminotransferase
MMGNHLMSTYKPLPVTFQRGNGIFVYDDQGKEYLDALCGISVTSLGHNHPAVTEAIAQQATQLLHTSNLYHIQNQQKLADLLCEASGMEQVFFGNSGAEANEAAIKLARLYGHKKDIKNPEIVVMEGSFHGRTMATLSATGNRKVQAGFEPLVSGFVRAPYNDIEALKMIAQNNRNVVAILVEPIQGEGGIVIPDRGYLKSIREICDQNNWLMMLDEIQTGMARSGQMFAFQHENIIPDVLTLAKALGNGIPIGACLAQGKASGVFQPGNHGSTFGGNPFACQVGYTVLKTMQQQKLAENAQQRGDQLVQYLSEKLADQAAIKQIRNLGLLIGITMDRDCAELANIALDNQLLINVTAGCVVRLLPPLIIDETQTIELADRLILSINQFIHQ